MVYDPSSALPVLSHIRPNSQIAETFRAGRYLRGAVPVADVLAIEMVANYGMPAGKTLFETCVWIGRFIEAHRGEHHLVYRRDVKLYLCNSSRARDANVMQALLDRYGGTRRAAVGTKKHPGPLYGFKSHLWAALGVAVTYAHAERSA